jgi:hypothetical protein
VTFNCTVSGDNQLVCKVIKFADRQFSKWSKHPLIVRVEDGLYVCLYQYGINGVTLAKDIYTQAIIPEAMKHRERVLQKNLSGLYQPILSSTSDVFEDLPVWEVDEKAVRAHYQYLCLASDGAFDQINAMIEWLIARAERLAQFILFVKYAAGCSMVQQVNDIGRMHKILKSQYRSQMFRLGVSDQPPGEHWCALKKLIESTTISGASFDTLWSALCSAGRFLNKAFSESNIDSAFKKSGVLPLNQKTILSSCYHFEKLSTKDAQYVLSKMPDMKVLVEKQGMVLETDFVRLLGDMPGIDNCPVKRNKQINKMALSRQRCMVVSHKFVLSLNESNKSTAVEDDDEEEQQHQDGSVIVAASNAATETPSVPVGGGKKRKRARGVETSGAPLDTTPHHAVLDTQLLAPKAKNQRERKQPVIECCIPNCWVSGCDKGNFRKCLTKKCKKWFCLSTECSLMFAEHVVECAKRK